MHAVFLGLKLEKKKKRDPFYMLNSGLNNMLFLVKIMLIYVC